MSVVLITGASSGIGRALALEYAKRGDSLVLIARREEKLNQVATMCIALNKKCSVEICVGDVSEKGTLTAGVDRALKRWGTLDIVIANAGIGISGTIAALSEAELHRQMSINLQGVLNTVQASLPALKVSRGRLAIVGSVMSYICIPGTGAYSMSKFAVRALADVLRMEEKMISVSLICPGFIESEIRKVDNAGTFHEDAKDPVPDFLVMSSEKAARMIAKGIAKRRREIAVTWYASWLIRLERFFPSVAHALWQRIN